MPSPVSNAPLTRMISGLGSAQTAPLTAPSGVARAVEFLKWMEQRLIRCLFYSVNRMCTLTPFSTDRSGPLASETSPVKCVSELPARETRMRNPRRSSTHSSSTLRSTPSRDFRPLRHERSGVQPMDSNAYCNLLSGRITKVGTMSV